MTILLVDDERQVLDGIRHGVDFQALGLDEVLTARSGEEAREIIEKTRVDILITDIEMADLSGLELLEWIRDSGQKILTIFCTAFRQLRLRQKGDRAARLRLLPQAGAVRGADRKAGPGDAGAGGQPRTPPYGGQTRRKRRPPPGTGGCGAPSGRSANTSTGTCRPS